MSALHRISHLSDRDARLTVVFVHGLGGDSTKTWRGRDGSFWPAWLAEDIEGLAVYSLGYEADITKWFGTSMALADRATNALAQLEAEGFGQTPIMFVTHSLGGLLVKQMIRNAHGYAQPNWTNLGKQIKCVIFLATPHLGARLADYLSALGKILLIAIQIKNYASNSFWRSSLNLNKSRTTSQTLLAWPGEAA